MEAMHILAGILQYKNNIQERTIIYKTSLVLGNVTTGQHSFLHFFEVS